MPVSSKLIQMSPSFVENTAYQQVLAKARSTYGDTAQILVSTEELCELAAVCAKYPRYTDPEKARSELHSKVIDEVADVLIVLDHVVNIFGLSDQEVQGRIGGKINRLNRWLVQSTSQEQTTIDRTVGQPVGHNFCKGCVHVGDFQGLKPGGRCVTCAANGFNLHERPRGGYTVRHQSETEDEE